MSDILLDRQGAVERIQINRPAKRNAFTTAMYADMAAALSAAGADPAVRVVVLTGAGGFFSAGNDVEDFLRNPPAGADSPVWRFLQTLAGMEKPLVAAVEGPAVGIGTTLLLHCDIVLASKTARFQLPFVDLGLVPEAGSSLLLPALAGYHKAAELLLLGAPFDAEAAERIGLVSRVVLPAELVEGAMALAEALALKPPASLRLTKRLLRRHTHARLAETMQEEGRLFTERLASPEAREALTAFLEKRKPDFSRFA
jgi:enoyl-CoA hydratase/carnithine racemase